MKIICALLAVWLISLVIGYYKEQSSAPQSGVELESITQSGVGLGIGFSASMSENEALSHARNVFGDLVGLHYDHSSYFSSNYFGTIIADLRNGLSIPGQFKPSTISFSIIPNIDSRIELHFIKNKLWWVYYHSNYGINAGSLARKEYGQSDTDSGYQKETADNFIIQYREYVYSKDPGIYEDGSSGLYRLGGLSFIDKKSIRRIVAAIENDSPRQYLFMLRQLE
jgi:hypothetical protein